jgi:hypothetical protein
MLIDLAFGLNYKFDFFKKHQTYNKRKVSNSDENKSKKDTLYLLYAKEILCKL